MNQNNRTNEAHLYNHRHLSFLNPSTNKLNNKWFKSKVQITEHLVVFVLFCNIHKAYMSLVPNFQSCYRRSLVVNDTIDSL